MASSKEKDQGAANAEILKLGWTVGKTLGEGAFGLVKFVTRKSDGLQAACKIIAKPKTPKEMKTVEMEYHIMKECDHPYIVKCFEAVQTDTQVFLFLELMNGGELFDKIVEMGSFTEGMAADVSYKCLEALHYMHEKGFVHRDLKPENMLLAAKGDLSAVKLTDFGLSAMIDIQSEVMKTACGTPAYVAPEILTSRVGYSKAVDVWSMGVIIYILLCGFPPFYAQNDNALYAKIKAGRYKFIRPQWDGISNEAKAFLQRMLVVDPTQRATIPQLLADPWLQTAAAEAKAGQADLKAPQSYQLKETEIKLARQTKALKYAITAATAKVRIANAIKLRRKRKEPADGGGEGGANATPEAVQVDVQSVSASRMCCCVVQ